MKTALWYATLGLAIQHFAHVSLFAVIVNGWTSALPALEALR
jgi:hypothetical protein